jgi:ATP-binding cassette subfamily B protein
MDEIIVLRDGRVVERGSHAELIGKNGLYRRLWDDQMHQPHHDAGESDEEDEEDEEDDE